MSESIIFFTTIIRQSIINIPKDWRSLSSYCLIILYNNSSLRVCRMNYNKSIIRYFPYQDLFYCDWNCWNLKHILSYGMCYFPFPFFMLVCIMVWCDRKSCVILLPNIPFVNCSKCTSYSKYEEQCSSYASLIFSILFSIFGTGLLRYGLNRTFGFLWLNIIHIVITFYSSIKKALDITSALLT